MMLVTGGATDVTTYFKLRKTADGLEDTGLTITDLDLQYTRSGVAPTAKVDATALAATDSAHSDNKAIEIDSTDQPGVYRVDWPDAAFAAGVKEVILTVKHSSCFTEDLRVLIDAPVNITKVGGSAASTPTTVDANVVQILGTAPTEGGAGRLAGAFTKFFNVVSPTGTVNSLPDALPFAAGGLAGDDDIQTLLARIGTPTNFGSGATLADNFDDIEALVDGLELGVNTLVTDWADGGRLDLLIDAILDDTGTSGVVVNAAGLAADAASEIATAVWASVTRTLTAIDEDSTTLDLDATIRAAVGLAAANLDTQLDALPTAAEITTAVWAAASRTLTALDEDTTTLDLDATIAAAFTAAVCNKIADHILRRDNANAEASANGDTLDVNSLYGIIQQLQLSNTVDNAGFLTIYKTDGTTELAQLALAVDASADPTTGIG
jgi:hypothetical protein